MAISGVNQVAANAGQSSGTTTSKNGVMGKDDFLHLLVAQLQAQDPLNPMDGTAFTAQLAQFSSLEQLQNINTALGTLSTSQSAQTNSQAVGYIGKTIVAQGNSFQHTHGQSDDLQYTLAQDAAGVYATVSDSQGNFIRRIQVGAKSAGQQSFSWDGRDYLGGQAPDGVYTFSISAVDKAGNSVNATQFVNGEVTGVNFKNGTAYLVCGNREIAMSDVSQVRTTPTN
ncbi:MAG: flagellar hook assembly protein FlgD [Desulfobacteraceae bacterium]|nr:flagellar hook assembly protein FlgD [Desulfobacteraceae bacterium]